MSVDHYVVRFKLPEEQPAPVVSFVKAGMTLTSMTSSFIFFPAAEVGERQESQPTVVYSTMLCRCSGVRTNLRGELRDLPFSLLPDSSLAVEI